MSELCKCDNRESTAASDMMETQQLTTLLQKHAQATTTTRAVIGYQIDGLTLNVAKRRLVRRPQTRFKLRRPGSSGAAVGSSNRLLENNKQQTF